VTVTGTSGVLSHSIDITYIIKDFALAAPIASVTALRGQTGLSQNHRLLGEWFCWHSCIDARPDFSARWSLMFSEPNEYHSSTVPSHFSSVL
jgi:hypothetical protein